MKAIIKYEDDAILVIHKPAGIATETARLGQADVVSELKNYLKAKGKGTYLGMIHRLDQPVEGLLVFAKTPEAAKILSKQLENGTLKKSYAALVPKIQGNADRQGELEDYLLKNAKTNLSMVVTPNTQGAKKAKLSWKLLHDIEKEEVAYSLVEVDIFTGRHHQIRAQLSAHGMVIKGDLKYGARRSNQDGSISLHARKIEFNHPVTKELISVTAPLSGEMQKIIAL